MAYVFESQKTATVNFTGAGRKLTLAGINGAEPDANVIVNGIYLLFSMAGETWSDDYDPREAVRTVKQNVNESE